MYVNEACPKSTRSQINCIFIFVGFARRASVCMFFFLSLLVVCELKRLCLNWIFDLKQVFNSCLANDEIDLAKSIAPCDKSINCNNTQSPTFT